MQSNDSIITDTIDLVRLGENLFIKDTSKYSDCFLAQVELHRRTDNMRLKLIDSVIVYKENIIEFPQQIKLAQEYSFEAQDSILNYKLTLKRISLSDLKYDLKITYRVGKKEYSHWEGIAAIDLYYLVNKSITYMDEAAPKSNLTFIKYSPCLNDGYISIYLERSSKSKLHACVCEGTFIIKPRMDWQSPIMTEK